MRYWILDTDTTPQRFPLQRLLRRVIEVVRMPVATCKLTKARGYGRQISQWEQQLDQVDALSLSIETLDGLSEGTEEWFYDVEMKVGEITFGLHDSTALFVDTTPEVASEVLAPFVNTRPSSGGVT